MKANTLFRATSTVILLSCSSLLFSQRAIKATGTGLTTGHIATIEIINTFPNSIYLVNTGNNGFASFELNDPNKNTSFSVTGRYNDQSEMVYIPSNGKDQSYVATGLGKPTGAGEDGEIKPDESITIPVVGYCTDNRRPPVPLGEPMPSISQWLHSSDVSIPVAVTLGKDGFYNYNNGDLDFVAINVPGQKYDNPLVVNQHSNPTDAAPFLFDAINRIILTTEILQNNNLINTPFSNNTPKERESVIQQTFWLYSSVLTGEDYSKDDFRKQMVNQYESNSGNKLNSAPEEVQEAVDVGVSSFWDAFVLVGVEAKVIGNVEMTGSSLPGSVREKLDNAFGKDQSGVKVHAGDAAKEASESVGAEAYETGDDIHIKDGSPSLHTTAEELAHINQDRTTSASISDESAIASEADDAEKEKKRCRCKEYSATIVVVDGDPDAIKPGREVIDLEVPVKELGHFPYSDEHVVDFNYSLKKGDKLSVSFSDVKLKCDCEETPCTTIHNKDPNVASKNTLSKALGKLDIKNTNFESKVLSRDKDSDATQSGTSATFKFTAKNNNAANETLHFQLHAFCSLDDCSRDRCIYDVRIKLKINQPEKK
jgi:hypothetical protein